MAISETAQRNHDELFPGHVSTLKVTDPELVETFDNFAFDETLRYTGLDTRTRLMVQLAALIAGQALSEYRVMLGAALTSGVTPTEAKEIVYQAVPYAGMGKAFDFIHATNDILAERGVPLPLDGQATATPQLATQLLDRGEVVVGTVRRPDSIADLVQKYPGTFHRELLDVSDAGAIRDVVDRSFASLERIDVVVSNAGYGLFGAAEELSDEQVSHIIATNLTGSIQLIRASLPHLRAQGSGRIIQISSYGGQAAFPGNSLSHRHTCRLPTHKEKQHGQAHSGLQRTRSICPRVRLHGNEPELRPEPWRSQRDDEPAAGGG